MSQIVFPESPVNGQDFVAGNGTTYTYDSSTGQWKITAGVGVVGPQGPTGATGPDGGDGSTGATGVEGPVGATAATGATGPSGADGATGSTGASGPGATHGTWSPTITSGGASWSSTTFCNYTKIGSLVLLTGKLKGINSISTGSTLIVGGLPCAANGEYSAICPTSDVALQQSATNPSVRTDSNASTMRFYAARSASSEQSLNAAYFNFPNCTAYINLIYYTNS